MLLGGGSLTDWSRDGKYLLCQVSDQAGSDLWYLERKGDGSWEPHSFLQEETRGEHLGKFSPDGRYVAYQSYEPPQRMIDGVLEPYEVYVQRFPEGGEKRKVSGSGGRQPRWSRDGKELFYIRGSTLMATPVSTAPNFSAGAAKPLFEDSALSSWGWAQYDVSADGERFILAEPVRGGEPTVQIVQNWFAEFRAREAAAE